MTTNVQLLLINPMVCKCLLTNGATTVEYLTPANYDECTTVGGSSAGEACTFPFKNPVTRELHWNCTTAPLEQRRGLDVNFASVPWCATETDAGDNMGILLISVEKKGGIISM